MRDLADIDRDITATARRLNELHAERQDVRQAQIDAAIRCFDAGRGTRQIALDLGMNKNTVAGILWRAGRTERGRSTLRRQIRQGVPAAALA